MCWFRGNPSWFNKLKVQVEEKYPHLKFFTYNNEILALRGLINLTVGSNTLDSYEIEIVFPKQYPSEVPLVRETAGRIPRILDRHVYKKTGFFCFGPRLAIKEAWVKNPILISFLSAHVIPFLANQSYYERTGEWKNGDYAHGKEGIIQYYSERFGIKDADELITVLNSVIGGVKTGRNNPCFCNSGKKAKKCHLSLALELRRLGDKRVFIEDMKSLSSDSKTSESQEKQALEVATVSAKLAPK